MKNSSKRVWPLIVLVWVAMATLHLQAPLATAAEVETKNADTMGHGSAEEIVVAKVNGTSINMAQLMRKMAEISRTKHGSQEISPLMAEKIKQEATDALVIEELAVQKATAAIKTISPTILDQKVKAIRTKYKSEQEFQLYIKDEFGGMAGLRKQMERHVALELFIGQEFDSKITVSDQDVQKGYEEGKAYFVADEFVQINDLIFFLDPADPSSASKIEAARQTIVDKYENDPSRLTADGTFALEKNVPLDKVKNKALYEAARTLKEYGWSKPVNVDGNLHIVQLVGHKPAINKSLKDVTPYLTDEIRKQKRQEMLNAWMAGLKTGANIEIIDLTR